jgi:hypothetical protein
MSEGINKDEGKLRVDLVAPEIIEAVARVCGEGRGLNKDGNPKYEDRNWELGMDWMRQYGSALRHLLKWAKGEDIDPESGCTHLEHALWRIGALVTYEKRRIGMDDRPNGGSWPNGGS